MSAWAHATVDFTTVDPKHKFHWEYQMEHDIMPRPSFNRIAWIPFIIKLSSTLYQFDVLYEHLVHLFDQTSILLLHFLLHVKSANQTMSHESQFLRRQIGKIHIWTMCWDLCIYFDSIQNREITFSSLVFFFLWVQER